jgi:cytochrome b6-f complex iron-sulfur subunit
MFRVALALAYFACAIGRKVLLSPQSTERPKTDVAFSRLLLAANPSLPRSLQSPFVGRHSGVKAAGASKAPVPDMQRRTILNLILLASAVPPVTILLGGYLAYVIPPQGGSGGGAIANDPQGNPITTQGWIDSHDALDKKLVSGIRGDPTYILLDKEKKIEDYGLNAVCTHLGCTVPWVRAQNKFMCPCHGSQYDATGKVVRGPAPLSLALTHVEDADGKIALKPWTETDFRTGLEPWWK